MGGGFNTYPQTNAPHRDQLGWFAKYPNLIRSTTMGQFKLFPLELPHTSGGLRVLKVRKNSSDTYYVSYRRMVIPFVVGTGYLNKVSIHRTRAGEPAPFSSEH
jgi:hypothetical protein